MRHEISEVDNNNNNFNENDNSSNNIFDEKIDDTNSCNDDTNANGKDDAEEKDKHCGDCYEQNNDEDGNVEDRDLDNEKNEKMTTPTDVHNQGSGLNEDNEKNSDTTLSQEEYKPQQKLARIRSGIISKPLSTNITDMPGNIYDVNFNSEEIRTEVMTYYWLNYVVQFF